MVPGAIVFVVYLAAALVAYAPAWADPGRTVIGAGGGDPAQSMWYLRYVPWALAHGHDPLVTHVANAPYGVNLLAQTSTLALGLLAIPVTLLWGPVAAYNVLITLAFPLSAGAAYLLARRFATWRPAAFVAGLVYGFSSYAVGQGLGHLNLVFVPLPPLILLVLHGLFVQQRGSPLRAGLLLAVLVVCQFFISTEILATTAVTAVIVLILLAVTDHRHVRAHAGFALRGLAVAGLISAATLAYPLVVLTTGPQHVAGAAPGFSSYRSALSGPLLAPRTMALSTAHLRRLADGVGGNVAENGSYLGPGLVLVVVLGAMFVRRRVARLAGLMAVIAFVLTLGSPLRTGIPSLGAIGSAIPLPAAVLDRVPLLRDAYPIRYSVYVALFAALVVAAVLDALHDRRSRPRHRHRRPAGTLLPTVVAVVVLVPLLPAWPYPGQGRAQVPRYFTTAAVHSIPPGAVTVLFPWPDSLHDQGQLWQASAGMHFRLAGGYFLVPVGPNRAFSYGRSTPTRTVLDQVEAGDAPARTPALHRQLRAELGSWDVQVIVTAPPSGTTIAFFSWLTGRGPSTVGDGVAAWYGLRWGPRTRSGATPAR